MTKQTALKFNNSINREFTRELMKRVDNYFRSNNISRNANSNLYFKTIVVFAMFFVPFGLLFTTLSNSLLIAFALYFVMGLGKAAIGLCIMHDANHGAVSKKKWVNDLLSYSLNVIGGSSTNWKIQHNYKHHTYTNVEGHDDDIAPAKILRFSPHADFKPIHKYQHWYAWFFYGLMTFSWIMFKDYKEIVKYHKDGLLDKHKTSFAKEMSIIIITKIIYITYMLILPIVFTSMPIWFVLFGFFTMHFVAGFILAIIFQPAHVLEENDFIDVDKNQTVIEDSWFSHQLKTTADFAQNNRLFSWFVGGLNFQVEHHLFPSIAHVHYHKIAPIVKETAQEFGIPYHSYKTFTGAVIGHFKMLRALGNPNIGQKYK
ncbi:MAG: fatty acid desaturase family protein [Bacteroidia bacterium]